GGIDEYAPGTNRRLEQFEQRSLSLERNGQHQKIRSGAGSSIFHAGDARVASSFFLDLVGGIFCALPVARTYENDFSCARPTQRETHPCRSGSSQNCNRAWIRQIAAPA